MYFGIFSHELESISTDTTRKALENTSTTINFKRWIAIVVKGTEAGGSVSTFSKLWNIVAFNERHNINRVLKLFQIFWVDVVFGLFVV